MRDVSCSILAGFTLCNQSSGLSLGSSVAEIGVFLKEKRERKIDAEDLTCILGIIGFSYRRLREKSLRARDKFRRPEYAIAH
jgi:hypothetical protein